MRATGPDEPVQVRIELIEHVGDAPGPPPPVDGGKKPIGTFATAVAALVVVGLLWWVARPEPGRDAAADPIVTPTTTTTTAPSTTEVTTTTTNPPEQPVVVAELDGLVTQVARSGGVTLVVHAGRPLGFPSLMRSADGREFEDVADPFSPQRLLSITSTPSGFSALAVSPSPIPPSAPSTPESGRVSTYDSPDGVRWTRTATHDVGGAALGVIDENGWATVSAVGADVPDPEVSAMLAAFVDSEAANATCEMRNPPTITADQHFELYDCTGALVGEVSVSDEQAESLWFATQILRGPFEVTTPGEGTQLDQVGLSPGSFAIGAVPTPRGPVVLLVDFYPMLQTDRSDFDDFRFTLARVAPSGQVELLPVPADDGFDPEVLLRGHLGSLAYEWGDDLYVRRPDGSSDWEAFSPLRPGQAVEVTVEGRDIVLIDRRTRETWVRGAFGTWIELGTEQRAITSVLYSEFDHALVLTERGEVLRVPLLNDAVSAAAVRRPLGEEFEHTDLFITSSGDGESFVGLTRIETGIGLLTDPISGAEALPTDIDPGFVPRDLRGDGQGLVAWGEDPEGDGIDVVTTSVGGRNWTPLALNVGDEVDRLVVVDVSRTSTSMALLAEIEPSERDLLLWQGTPGGEPTTVADSPCPGRGSCAITSFVALPDGILALHESGAAAELSVWRPQSGWSSVPVEATWAAGVDVLPPSARLQPREPGLRDPRGGAPRPFLLTNEWVGLLSIEHGVIEKLWDAPASSRGRFDGVGRTGLVAAYSGPGSVYVYSNRSLEWTHHTTLGLESELLLAITSDGALYRARGPDGPELVLFRAGPDLFDP